MTFNANLPHMDEPGFEVTEARARILIVDGKRPGEKRPRPGSANSNRS